MGAPATAQTPRQPTRSSSPETFVAVLTGAYAVPEVDTRATGTAELRLIGSRLHYQLHVDSLRDVTGAYVHIGRAGETAPAVADLFDGVKAGPVSVGRARRPRGSQAPGPGRGRPRSSTGGRSRKEGRPPSPRRTGSWSGRTAGGRWLGCWCACGGVGRPRQGPPHLPLPWSSTRRGAC